MGNALSFQGCHVGAPGSGGTAGGVDDMIDLEQAEITRLCFNASRGRVDAVRTMLQEGRAKATDVGYDRRSALHIAAAEGHLAVVELLVAQRADVNAKDRRGVTPLDEAAYGGHAEVKKALLAAGATGAGDADAVGVSGSMSTRVSSTSMDSALSLGCATAAGAADRLQELHAAGADLNAVDYDGRTALHVAASRGHAEIITWLVSMKASVDHRDNFGRTAAAEAQRMGHNNIVEILTKAGAAQPEADAQGDVPWGIPMSEISLGEELSATLKSVVYRATWRGTLVVCKTARMLPTAAEGEAPTGISPAEKELIREIQLLSMMRHPDLVLFLGACVEHSPAFVITEFMEGGDLERYYRARSVQSGSPYVPPGRKLLRWASSVARALAFLHGSSCPIIHRDLKPLNLLLNSSEELKVTDFGISKLLETNMPGARRMSGGVGTWRYMAPEVVRWEDYTDRVDIFSYALVVWFMATGLQPYVKELGKDPEDVLREFVQGKEPRPDARAMKCPPAMKALTEECWHVAATSRPSALECTKRLAAITAEYRESPMESIKKRFGQS